MPFPVMHAVIPKGGSFTSPASKATMMYPVGKAQEGSAFAISGAFTIQVVSYLP